MQFKEQIVKKEGKLIVDDLIELVIAKKQASLLVSRPIVEKATQISLSLCRGGLMQLLLIVQEILRSIATFLHVARAKERLTG